MSRRFLSVVGSIALLVLAEMTAADLWGNSGQQQQPQQQTQQPVFVPPSHVNTVPHGSGVAGSAHTNTIQNHAGARPGVGPSGGHLGSVTVPGSQAILKGALQASTSKVQQHLYATGMHRHRPNHQRRWDYYEILPFKGSSVVTSVESGDRLTVVNADGETQQARLAGVAAPVDGQPFFSLSRDHLAGLTLGKRVQVLKFGADDDGTPIAQVVLSNSGISVNYHQVYDGLAFPRPSDGCAGSLWPVFESAIDNGRGFWRESGPHTPPWAVASRAPRTK
jgi:endonuclease YncB( thermonuclease family)